MQPYIYGHLVTEYRIIVLMRGLSQMYASHLQEKASELKKEKRKSDMLLYQMLPPSVAMQLKQNEQVNIIMFVNSNT